MKTEEPDFFIEIFLQPGDFYWGEHDTRIRTLLGSCVSITLWHPKKRHGGMCHFMLPRRLGEAESSWNGRYAEEAMNLFLEKVEQNGANPREYEAKMFGGSNMFPGIPVRDTTVVGEKNVNAARDLLETYGLRVVAEDVGGIVHRRIFFDVWDGAVWVKKNKTPINEDIL